MHSTTRGKRFFAVTIMIASVLSFYNCNSGGGSTNSNNIVVNPIPDTGQMASYTNTYGEDSDYTINPPLYVDNGDGTITDEVTGLIWQKQDDGLFRTWNDANGYCANLSLSGVGWRLPAIFELIGITDYSIISWPTISSNYFPNTQATYYWSDTTGTWSSIPWGVLFNGGVTGFTAYPAGSLTRCVRGLKNNSVFSKNGDGTVADLSTNLIWQKQDDGIVKSWEQALIYCEGLSLGNFTDWRLPNVKELNSIVDFTSSNPSINATYFPNAQPAYYWTSTTNANSSASAFLVAFGSGMTSGTYAKTSFHYTRCVRGGL